jgi:hypothetical protein
MLCTVGLTYGPTLTHGPENQNNHLKASQIVNNKHRSQGHGHSTASAQREAGKPSSHLGRAVPVSGDE